MADRRTKRKPAPRAGDNRLDHDVDGPERLQKVMAAAGIGSRRECEEMILEGRVEVDRKPVTELGTRVDPTSQQIHIDGTALPTPKREYYVLNKPTGVVCTNSDPTGRTRVIDLIRSDERLFPVGRLDKTSEGLILVTNDGELSNKLTHPRYGIEKTYRVRVAGQPEAQLLGKLRRGVRLADGFAKVESIVTKRRLKGSTELEIVLNEGRNREIRRLLARIGHKVLSLKRVAIGPLRLGDLPVGAHRPLERDELARLRKALVAQRKAAPKHIAKRGATKQVARPKRPAVASATKPAPAGKKPARNKPTREKTPHTGAVLGFEDEARPTKKRPTKKRAAKKSAKKTARKKSNVTRKKRR